MSKGLIPHGSKGIRSAVAISVVALISGCQFGNRETTLLSGYDVISGYYSTLPQSIAFHAQIGTGTARDVNGLVNQIPDFLKSLMGDPVLLYYDSPTNGVGTIRANDNTDLFLATKIDDSAGTFGYSSTATQNISGCEFREEITTSGTFAQGSATPTVDGFPVRGNLGLDYSATYTLTGDDADCDALRASLQSCYSDGTGCSPNSGDALYGPYVEQVFGPIIGAGVMTESEISSARSVGYHAVYR
jgi:hypothetical protein